MKIFPYLLVLLVGIIAGHFLKNPSEYHIVKNVSIGDLGNVILALTAALFLPFTLNKWINSKQYLKTFYINELQHFLNVTEKIKSKLNDCCHKGQTTENDKKEIQLLFLDSDLLMVSLKKQLKNHYKKKIEHYVENLNTAYYDYWKTVTGGQLFSTKYSIEMSFCKETSGPYLTFEQKIKEGICLINDI